MEELLARAPGGAAANVLYSEDVDGPVIYVHDTAVLAELTKEWRQIAARNFAQMEGPAFVSLLAVTPAHLLVSQEAWKRRSEEHTSELQSLMRISYAVFCLQKKN